MIAKHQCAFKGPDSSLRARRCARCWGGAIFYGGGKPDPTPAVRQLGCDAARSSLGSWRFEGNKLRLAPFPTHKAEPTPLEAARQKTCTPNDGQASITIRVSFQERQVSVLPVISHVPSDSYAPARPAATCCETRSHLRGCRGLFLENSVCRPVAAERQSGTRRRPGGHNAGCDFAAPARPGLLRLL